MALEEDATTQSTLLKFHDHRGDSWNVHTESISLRIEGDKAHFSGCVYDPVSMAYGDGQTNEYDWADVEVSADQLIDGLSRVLSGQTWEQEQLRFDTLGLIVGNSSLYSPGPARAVLSAERSALLFLDAHDAIFATLDQARTGIQMPARELDQIFLQALRTQPEHLSMLRQVGFERTVRALLQEAHLNEIHATPLAESQGLWLVTARGDERGQMLVSIESEPGQRVGLQLVDRVNGMRDRKRADKAVILTRSSFTDDVVHDYAGRQDRIQLVDYDRLLGTLTDAG